MTIEELKTEKKQFTDTVARAAEAFENKTGVLLSKVEVYVAQDAAPGQVRVWSCYAKVRI